MIGLILHQLPYTVHLHTIIGQH